jgi:hypothetical protein
MPTDPETAPVLLDTGAVIAHMVGHAEISQRICAAERCFLPVTALGELRHGVHKSQRQRQGSTKEAAKGIHAAQDGLGRSRAISAGTGLPGSLFRALISDPMEHLIRAEGSGVFTVLLNLDLGNPDAAFSVVQHHGVEYLVKMLCESFTGAAGQYVGLKQVPELPEERLFFRVVLIEQTGVVEVLINPVL